MDTDEIVLSNASAPDGPKKYIRTFEGDMSMLKSGGIPNLAPLPEPKPAPLPAESIAAPEPPADYVTAAPPEPPPQEPLPEPPQEPLPEPVLEVVPAAAPEPLIEQPVPIQPAPTQFESAGPLPIQTYASDFSDRMKEMKASSATVLASEQDAAGPPAPEPQPQSRSNALYISAGAVLIIAGSVGAYFAYQRYAVSIAPVITAPGISVPIFVDEHEEISGTGGALMQAIEQSNTRSLASGAIRLLYSENTTTTSNIFSALQLGAPDILLRNLNSKGSMAGIINADSQNPFFILSVSSYSDTFSGMLQWEHAMPSDLEELFPPFQPAAHATTTALKAATTTSAVQKATFIAGFRDETISNHDARVYLDAQKRIVLLYGYWNQTTLIIARDPAAFTEIINRLATSHTP